MFSFIGLASSWCLLTETETLVKQTSLLHSFLSAYWMSWGEQLPPSCVPSAMIVSLILDPYNRVRRSRDNSMNKANPFFTLCLLGVVTVKKKKKFKSHCSRSNIQGDELEAVSPCLPLFLLSLLSLPSLTDPIPKIPLLQTKMKLLIFIYLIVYSSTTKPPMNIMNIITLSLKEIISSFGSSPGHYRHMVLQLA